jgi:hypothetical protein
MRGAKQSARFEWSAGREIRAIAGARSAGMAGYFKGPASGPLQGVHCSASASLAAPGT